MHKPSIMNAMHSILTRNRRTVALIKDNDLSNLHIFPFVIDSPGCKFEKKKKR